MKDQTKYEIHQNTVELPEKIKTEIMNKALTWGESFASYIHRVTERYLDKGLSVNNMLREGTIQMPALKNDAQITFRMLKDSYEKILDEGKKEQRSFAQMIRAIIIMDLKGLI